MKVIVDVLRCDAHGVCVDACPEVFALSDEALQASLKVWGVRCFSWKPRSPETARARAKMRCEM